MDETERAALVESIWESWLSGGVETVRDLIKLSVDATLAVDVDEVDRAEALSEWQCPGCGSVTRARMADAGPTEAEAMRTTIAEYVGDVSDAAKFIALVELVPGLHPSGAMVGAP